MEKRNIRVLFMVNIPAPYRVDFFNELGKYCELTVLFDKAASDERNAAWKEYKFTNFSGVILKGVSVGTDKAFCPGILRYLKKGKYDIVISANRSTPSGKLAILHMRLHRIPFYTEGDGAFVHKDSWLKAIVKRFLVSGAKGWFTTGSEYETSLVLSGADRDRFIRYPLSSIHDADIRKSLVDLKEKKELRCKLGIKEPFIVTTVGRFSYDRGYGKGFDKCIEVATMISKDIGIYIIGDEPTDEFISMKRDSGADNVHFVGYKQRGELAEYYDASDLFLLLTRGDTWGLVIIEAMAHGLPVISSNRCLSAREIIRNGENGFLVNFDDTRKIADLVERFASSALRVRDFGKKSLEAASQFTIEQMVDVHVAAFERIREDQINGL